MVVVKEKEVAKQQEKLAALRAEGQGHSAALEAAEQHFRAVSAGLSSNEDGEEATLAGQMMTCKNDMSRADTEAKQVGGGACWVGGRACWVGGSLDGWRAFQITIR